MCNRSINTRKAKLFNGTAHLPYMRFTILSTLCTCRMMVKIGIPSIRYENRKKPGPRRNVVVRVWVRLIKTKETLKKGWECWCPALGVGVLCN